LTNENKKSTTLLGGGGSDSVGGAKRVTGGNRRRVQVREAPRGSFTAAKQQIFLDHLASCCNVTRAAAAAGVG
jgi:hypothetical protein